MKKFTSIIILFMIIFYSTCDTSRSDGLGTYSEGWRMGELTKFSIKGIAFLKSGEGQLLLGADSTPFSYTQKNEDGTEEVISVNPWYFSSIKKETQSLLNNNIGKRVAIKYKQPRINSLNVDTEYEVVEVLDTSNTNQQFNDVCEAKEYVNGKKSKGVRVGRIVKTSEKGTVFKSHEILMQQGTSGNQFVNMSISKDVDMYECAVKYLQSAKKVRVTYLESFTNIDFTSRETNYDIIKIEPIN